MHLLSLGLPAHKIGNAPKNDYETTIIYYKPGAENIARMILLTGALGIGSSWQLVWIREGASPRA